ARRRCLANPPLRARRLAARSPSGLVASEGGAMDDGTSRAGRRNAFGVIAGALFVIGPALAWLRIVPGIAGFGLFALGGMVGLVAGVASVVQAARGRGLGRCGALAVAVGAVLLALASRGVCGPGINDFTTDPTDPPACTYADTLPP